MRVGWSALATVSVVVGAACDLGLSESDIRQPSGTGGATSGGGGAGGQLSTSTGTGTGMGTGGRGGAPAPATSCWEQPFAGWSVQPIDTTELTGASPAHVSVSSDGLRATYDAGPADGRRAYVATRSDRAASFSGGTLMALWKTTIGDVRHPVLSAAETELYVEHQGDVLRSVLVPGGSGGAGSGGMGGGASSAWSTPTRVLPLSDVASEQFPSLTEDGLRIVFQRKFAVGAPHLVEGTRQAVGDAFVEQPVVVPNLADSDAERCPVLAPDGLVLFFASTFGETPTIMNANTKWKVLATRRASLGGAWGDAVEIAVLDHQSLAVCPSAVTADGCELSFFHYDLGSTSTVAELIASRNLPQQ